MSCPANKKYTAVYAILHDGRSVSTVALELGVSRKAIYEWIARYRSSHGRMKKFVFDSPRYAKGAAHPRAYRFKMKSRLIKEIAAHPISSATTLSRTIGIGRHALVSLLNDLGLETRRARLDFSSLYNAPGRLKENIKHQLINEIQQEGKSVQEASKEWHVSRKTIWQWRKQLAEQGSLRNRYLSGQAHPKALSTSVHQRILKNIVRRPQSSISDLADISGCSAHGIYNVLKQYNLTTLSQRRLYVAHIVDAIEIPKIELDHAHTAVPTVLTPQEAPAPPPTTSWYPAATASAPNLPLSKSFIFKHLLIKLLSLGTVIFSAPFSLKNPLVAGLAAFCIPLSISFGFFALYSHLSVLFRAASVGISIGYFFASIALMFGFFFLLYSVKYYISSILVLLFSRKELLRSGKDIAGVNSSHKGLMPDVSHIQLERHPFVSIHLPLYNEKRVVNRLLEAVTSMDYDNFEVIVCDDSTDETKDLVADWAKHPKVKISHRENRHGFKGAALKQAMGLMDPRTEFVMVFDADFLPFPDTIEQFLKYFKNVVGTIEQQKYSCSSIAAFQGYQWHVLNKSENWITRGVRTEYGGSYVIERSSEEIYSGLKQIAGSVFMIRADVLKQLGWRSSITEDFELTLRLYSAGYKVVYTPYVQAPSECVSTIKRLIRQRMRWAEGHSFNMKKYFWELFIGKLVSSPDIGVPPTFVPSPLKFFEKLELLYLGPFYLQSFFFIAGTLCWFIAEAVLRVQLPYWTAVWGWSLVITNIISLPLMNIVGMFMEEAEEKDYLGIASFIALTYTIAPFQAYAAVKGFLENSEGPWFRTPKTGRITDTFKKGTFYSWLFGFFQKPQSAAQPLTNSVISKKIPPKNRVKFGNLAFAVITIITVFITSIAPLVPLSPMAYASEPVFSSIENSKSNTEKEEARSTHKGVVSKDSETIRTNARRKEITSPRFIGRTSKGGKQVEFIFNKEPSVRVKVEGYEVSFTTLLLGGKVVSPKKATILDDREVVYSEIVKDVDLRYRLTNDLLVEEFIVKTPEAAKLLGSSIEQEVHGIGIQFVSPTPESFGIYSKDGKEIFTLSQPFAVDAKGIRNNDFKFELSKGFAGYTLTKKFGGTVQNWLASSEREYPIIIDPSVVVSGGIAEGEVQYGGLLRKVAFVNSNWYAFYADGGQISYKKSADGVSWADAVVISGADVDEYNPAITVSGNTIIIAWSDDGDDGAELNTLDTSNDTLGGTLCDTPDGGTIDMTTVIFAPAAVSTTAVIAAGSDIANTVGSSVIEITGIGAGACTVTDRSTGNITFGSGFGTGDRGVVVAMNSTRFGMVFQDGDLSYSIFDDTLDEWVLNNLTIASVTDNVYSVTTDGTSIWVLSVSGTTATNFYKCCTDDWAETSIDADAGGNNQDGTSDIDMYCPSEDNCKIVYTDDIDTTAPKLKFVDCNDATCSSPTVTTLDADIGASGDQAGASIYCVASDNCKIAYGDAMDTTLPLLNFIDCTADEDCSTNTNTGSLDADLGGNTSVLHTATYCPADNDCKIVYNDFALSDVYFVDCPDATCTSTGRTITTIDATSGAQPKLDLDCSPGAADCKIIYHDTSATGGCADAAALCFIDCGSATCTGNATAAVDGDIGTTTGQPVMALDCTAGATDCKIAYGDVTAGDLFFADCSSASCNTRDAITTMDTSGGAAAQLFSKISLDCVSATDCKVSYVGNTTTGSEEAYFIDCDGAACATGSVVEMKGPRFAGATVCLTSTNCKFAYYDGTAAANPAVIFADCDVTNCFPSSSTLTAPWTSETNVTSVSLTYDSSNSDIYAHVIKDSSEQAYWNKSDATTISWDGSTSYGFTAGDLGHISAPITAAGTTQVGVVVRQGTNFEFATVPEHLLLYLITLPLYYLWRKKRKNSPYEPHIANLTPKDIQ